MKISQLDFSFKIDPSIISEKQSIPLITKEMNDIFEKILSSIPTNQNNSNLNHNFTPATQRVINIIFNIYPSASAQITPIKSNIDKVSTPTIYPGKFICTQGDWNTTFRTPGSQLCRNLEFGSTSPESTFSKMSLAGYLDGSVQLFVGFSDEKWESASAYLAKQGIPKSIFMPYGFHTQKPDIIRKAVNIITSNNEFNEKDLDVINKIVEKL